MLKGLFNVNDKLIELAEKAENMAKGVFSEIEKTGETNQLKVIKAMQENRVSEAFFYGSTGYGYGDIGRDAIDNIYAKIFGAEDAVVRSQFVNGTQALNCSMWAVLRPGDTLLAVTGKPYDTLEESIISGGNSNGSLEEFGIKYKQIDLLPDGRIDYSAVEKTIKAEKIKVVYIQRSKGYAWRPALCIDEMKRLIDMIKKHDENIVCLVDNCYGEFVEFFEPTQVGADLAAGSLIKNPGGGMAKTGGYIVGRKGLVEKAACRLTSPGIGKECGATLGVNRDFLMGLFFAPHVVAESLRGAVFCSILMKLLGFEVSPSFNEKRTDIIQAVKFDSKEKLIAFCQGIQKGAAVDAHVTPQPWDMPGYSEQVIMAAGTFVQGASIEMSADAPIRPPYAVYIQGGLTYTHAKLSVIMAVQELIDRGLISVNS